MRQTNYSVNKTHLNRMLDASSQQGYKPFPHRVSASVVGQGIEETAFREHVLQVTERQFVKAWVRP